jgi:uncharacterized membrane protein
MKTPAFFHRVIGVRYIKTVDIKIICKLTFLRGNTKRQKEEKKYNNFLHNSGIVCNIIVLFYFSAIPDKENKK